MTSFGTTQVTVFPLDITEAIFKNRTAIYPIAVGDTLTHVILPGLLEEVITLVVNTILTQRNTGRGRGA